MNITNVCVPVPFRPGMCYEYGPIWLSYWDKVGITAIGLALIVGLVAIAITEIQKRG